MEMFCQSPGRHLNYRYEPQTGNCAGTSQNFAGRMLTVVCDNGKALHI